MSRRAIALSAIVSPLFGPIVCNEESSLAHKRVLGGFLRHVEQQGKCASGRVG
jgi:hypothetical protein